MPSVLQGEACLELSACTVFLLLEPARMKDILESYITNRPETFSPIGAAQTYPHQFLY